jgi:hypothetical protein
VSSPLQATNDDIKHLKDSQLVHLLWQLVYLELSANGIEKFDSQVPLSIYIKDGGIDGLARWADGPGRTAMFPGRTVGFQAKATDMTDAACAAEVRAADGSLKPQVRRLVEQGGAYVLFLGRDCVTASKEPRIAAIKEAIVASSTANGAPALDAPEVFIYDASEIAAWVNSFPAAVAVLFDFLGRSGAGACSWTELSGYPTFQNPFAQADGQRAAMLHSLRSIAGTERSVTRITGTSGLGKTRLVLEAFRPPDNAAMDPFQAKLSSSFCYLNPSWMDNVVQLVRAWRRTKSTGTVVVDDCPLDLHETLAEEVRHGDCRLALITIGNDLDPSPYIGASTTRLCLEAASTELIQELLDTSFKSLREEDRRFIASDLAQGYPLMAMLTAIARLNDAPLSAKLTPTVLAKLLGKDVAETSRSAKVISVCALFDCVGVDGEAAEEREFVRQTFCPEVSADEFYADLVDFQKRGVVSRYGRVAQVRPKPLAIRLAADWWEKCSPERAAEIVQLEFPASLADAFCERLRTLDFVPALRSISERLCSRSGPFGQAKVLSSELGSQLFRAVAEVNPIHAVGALDYSFGAWSQDQLSQLDGDVRRNLVWALEKLAFWEETFPQALAFLTRLAAVENERWSNNATGVLKRLFMVLLSGTQANLAVRLPLLTQMARSSELEVRRIAVAALENALTSSNFTGTSGPELQGSGGPRRQYRPKTWGEVFGYWTQCLDELIRLSKEDAELGDEAAAAIAVHIRGLTQHGRLDDVERALQEVGLDRRKNGKVWAQAFDAVKDVLKYDLGGAPAGTEGRVREWLNLLTPVDLLQRLKLLVTEAPFDHIEVGDGNWVDVAARDAESLGHEVGADWSRFVEHLGIVIQDEQRQAYPFGRGLARGSGASKELYAAILSAFSKVPIARRNSALLSGWLAAIDEREAQNCDQLFSEIASQVPLRESLPSIARGLKLNDLRVATLRDLLEGGHITANQLYGLSSGQAMSCVSVDSVAALSKALVHSGTDGAWVALDILFMYSYGNAALVEALQSQFRDVVLAPGMLSSEPATRNSHEYEVAAIRLVKQSPEVARQLSGELCTAIVGSSKIGDHLAENLLAALLEHQSEASWPILRKALSEASGVALWRFSDALGSPARIGDHSGPIDKLDRQLLREWCASEPELAPPLVARLIGAIEKDEGDVWRLSASAQMLVDEFGDSVEMLDALGASLQTFIWAGSLVPFYERQITVVSPLLTHHRETVRAWARRIVDGARESRDREAQRDEEQKLGRW